MDLGKSCCEFGLICEAYCDETLELMRFWKVVNFLVPGTKTITTFYWANGINAFFSWLMQQFFAPIFVLFIKSCKIHSFCAKNMYVFLLFNCKYRDERRLN